MFMGAFLYLYHATEISVCVFGKEEGDRCIQYVLIGNLYFIWK